MADKTPDDSYLPKPRLTREPSVTLTAGASRWWTFVGVLAINVVCNGIVSLFVYYSFKHWSGGLGSWVLAIFISIFVLIGLWLLTVLGSVFLELFNPRPILTLPTDAVRMGEPFDLAWDMVGHVSRVRRLRISLRGEEAATYTRGTDMTTEREVFDELILCDTKERREIAGSAASIVIPMDTIHSFVAKHNKVEWTLQVEGDIPRWPNIDDTFEVVIWPPTYTPRRDERTAY